MVIFMQASSQVHIDLNGLIKDLIFDALDVIIDKVSGNNFHCHGSDET